MMRVRHARTGFIVETSERFWGYSVQLVVSVDGGGRSKTRAVGRTYELRRTLETTLMRHQSPSATNC